MAADVVVVGTWIDRSGSVGDTVFVPLGLNTCPPASLDCADSPIAFTAVTL